MRKFRGTLELLLILALVGAYWGPRIHTVRAQSITGATPYGFTVTGTLANCAGVSTIPTGTAGYCFTNTGAFQSIGGSAWSPLGGGAVAGVTSWNGLTGAVTYTAPTPPVTSVNGKTGQVVLGATTTLQ